MQTQIIPVPFYEDTLLMIGKDNEPMVAMKPIVENMGLDWGAQQIKLSEKFGSVSAIIPSTGGDGKTYNMICLPLRKLPAWLYSINPSKVKPELREKVIRYQEECDDALWNYWTQGTATRPGTMTVADRLRVHRARHEVINKLVDTTHAFKRQALYEELTEISTLLGYAAPALAVLGSTEPDEPAVMTEFWDAIEELNNLGIKTNHARDTSIIAININEVVRLAQENKIPLPNRQEIRRNIHLSKYNSYLINTVVNSAIAGKSMKCYIFKALGNGTIEA
ncbi:phage antirepressor N-terminal domain-containing protein [Undibacterium sp. Ji42W]|uniref:phage antirepressor N-terminal domain-containing protein n=1 Tax=Undibacterium sp. Ji42W TaxID=3413039 RepID=UPI003BF0B89A